MADDRTDDAVRDDQRGECCPTCGALDHWHRRDRVMHSDCVAQLARAAVIRLRASSRASEVG